MAQKCKQCGSSDTEQIRYMNLQPLKCRKCGYDESEEYAIVPEEKTSQREKARYSPYKSGGHQRTKRKS